MHPSHLIPSWPPWALLMWVLGSSYNCARTFRAVIPQTCLYIKITWGLKKYTDSWAISKLSELEHGQESVCIFYILFRVWEPWHWELCSLWTTACFSCRVSNHLLAYLPSTFKHILWSKCLASVRKTGENVRLCQLKSIFTWEACWHICVTSKCLSKLLKKKPQP